MKKIGYRPEVAGAIEAAASTGGQFMPPVMGGVIFLMVEWLDITYLDACWAAWLPATLYFFSIFMAVDFEAGKTGLKGLPGHLLPTLGETIKKGWWHFAPLFLLIYFLAVSLLDAEKAVLYSLGGLLVISMFFKEGRMGPRKLLEALDLTFRSYLLVGVSCAAAGVIVGCLTLTGVGVKLAGGLLSLSGGYIPILLLLAAASAFIMGMGMITLPIYVILAILVVPALVKVGVPELAAHFFIFVCGLLSFVTPPVALAAYAAAGISGGSPMRTGVQATRMAIGIFLLPFWFVYRPALLMMGSPAEIVYSAIGAIIAIVAISAGLGGYAVRGINMVERVLLMIGAIMLIAPTFWGDIVGFSIIGLIAIHHFVFARKIQHQEKLLGTAEDSVNGQTSFQEKK